MAEERKKERMEEMNDKKRWANLNQGKGQLIPLPLLLVVQAPQGALIVQSDHVYQLDHHYRLPQADPAVPVLPDHQKDQGDLETV